MQKQRTMARAPGILRQKEPARPRKRCLFDDTRWVLVSPAEVIAQAIADPETVPELSSRFGQSKAYGSETRLVPTSISARAAAQRFVERAVMQQRRFGVLVPSSRL